MFQATQLIEFIKEQRKNQNTSINDVNEYKCLNQIINYIELITGWEYINNSFIFRTNFKYDREKKDITFDIYKVERRKNLYICTSNNPIELSFLKENQFLLGILENLQQKQPSSYKEQNNNEDKIIGLEEKKIKIEAHGFSMLYSYMGIYNLVVILNKLIKSNNAEEFYQELKKEEADKGYFEQVINWAKLYTGKGKALYEIYKKDQEKIMKASKKNTYILSFPNITE